MGHSHSLSIDRGLGPAAGDCCRLGSGQSPFFYCVEEKQKKKTTIYQKKISTFK
jgi:hypothetical protein